MVRRVETRRDNSVFKLFFAPIAEERLHDHIVMLYLYNVDGDRFTPMDFGPHITVRPFFFKKPTFFFKLNAHSPFLIIGMYMTVAF